MRRRCITMSAAVAAAAACSGLLIDAGAVAGTRAATGARAAVSGGTWGSAEEVPGSAALNQGGTARIASVSCGTAGNCSAGGDYTGSAGRQEAFVADEVNGTWHRAREVPG